jgi:hypothetical protein
VRLWISAVWKERFLSMKKNEEIIQECRNLKDEPARLEK